jgi:LysM repeat protein
MAYRSSRRWLAPAALAAAGAALLATVSGGGNADVSRPRAAPAGESRPGRPSSYTVKPGDVLSTIAETTGVPLARIERLNPAVDAKALHAGQQIKIAP